MAEPRKTVITPEDNGPYWVQGPLTIRLPSGREIEIEDEAWLCRCGGSQDKPFCDSTHSRIGFQAAEAAVAEAESEAATEEGFETVAEASALGEGDLLGVHVGGKPVVIGRVGGQVYAIGGICSHAYARLEDGDLDGEVVMCPLHNSGFDIKTGAAIRLPATEPVPTYQVRLEGGQIQVARRPDGGSAG